MNQIQAIPSYDAVVVGAGMSGMYTALKLADAEQQVALFEMSDRFGGRVETVLMGRKNANDKQKFKAEFGPMRFEKEGQKLLRALLEELELEYSPFPPYRSAQVIYPKYNITKADEQNKNPLELLMMGILKILGKHTPFMNNQEMQDQIWRLNEDNISYDYLRKTAEQGGVFLYKRGFWNALSDVLSHQAVLKIRDTGSFYHLIPDNPNAIEWIIFWLRGLQPDDQLVGIKGGSRMLPNKLWDRILNHKNIVVHQQHTLVDLQAEDKQVFLTFKGEIVRAAFAEVEIVLPEDMISKRAGERGWLLYSKSAQGTYHYFVQGEDLSFFDKNGDGMVMVYTDRPANEYWNNYIKDRESHDRAAIRKNDKLKGRFVKYLKDKIRIELAIPLEDGLQEYAADQPMFRPPFDHIRSTEALMEAVSKSIIDYGIRDWGLDPYGAGCHAWRPNYKSWEVMDQLKAFRLPGSPGGTRNIHICGEAYSDYQGFIEGALRTAEDVLETILGKKFN